MADQFTYDVFLSHSSKDKEVVRDIAARLRDEGLRVWFEEWMIKSRTRKAIREQTIEEGLENSRVLVLCMSANAFGSDWAALESQTFRFRDPLNKERRFIPLRLDNAPIKGSLAQFSYINWLAEDREEAYAKLLEACPSRTEQATEAIEPIQTQVAEKVIQLNYEDIQIWAYAFSLDGKRILTGAEDKTVQLWDVETGQSLQILEGHTNKIWSVSWSADQRYAISGDNDDKVRLWDIETGQCLRIFEGHTSAVWSVAWSPDDRRVVSGSLDHTARLWDVETGQCLGVFRGHTNCINSLAWNNNQHCLLSGADDNTIRLWDVETGRCLRVLEGHTGSVSSVAFSSDSRRAISGSNDKTVRLWDIETGQCLRVFEGHTQRIRTVVWSADQRHILSGADDRTIRLWDVETGQSLQILEGHPTAVKSVMWSANQHCVISGDWSGGIRVWDLSEFIAEANASKAPAPTVPTAPKQIQYTNAKVLLVGESGAGKTGLSKRLALNEWEPSDSTVGAWATQWKLDADSRDGVEREIWLWDFGGQADQRLIHQLYMDETALTVLVFDGQKEDLFETLGQWDRDLTRASQKTFAKLLVAGRVDAGGLRISRNQIETFARERGYTQLLETSAKVGTGCSALKQAILDGIQWDNIPWRSSPLLFKRLKEEIIRLKDESRVLLRFNELRETLTLRLVGEDARFSDDELRAVVSLLAGPGVVWELKFGSWILLQPERINAYAQAVIQTLREDEYERGCLPEERVLSGNLTYHSSMKRLESDEERFVLLAMHQTLVERGLCLREHTGKGALLVFPSYYRRERPELVEHPAVLVSYRFNGFLDDIYATLVVRLHHTGPFQQDELWRYAADFKTLTGKQLGVKLIRRSEGAGELEVYFDPAIPMEEKIIFSKYVHEHLLKNARDVDRLRYYVCPHCKRPVRDREMAMERLAENGKQANILCVKCEKRVPLWDELEELFASPVTKQKVRQLQEQSQIVLDTADKERTLVGEVISTASLAGQICRELTVSDNGIDMEIEFKTDEGRATGRKLYLQLKSGDSYLSTRKRDGAEIFKIEKPRHVQYWMDQAFPVLLVIRNSKGEVRWMEVRDYLKRESDNGKKAVRQIIFEGERFDVMSVRGWRDRVLKG